MINKKGKLFQQKQSSKIESFIYSENKNYYDLIREAQEKGYRQSIVTSDIMIAILEHFLINHKSTINTIEFLVDDDQLKYEIDIILSKVRENPAYWAILKKKLESLSRYDYIDIKKIEVKCIESMPYIFYIMVNGVFGVSENVYDNVSVEISRLLEDYVK